MRQANRPMQHTPWPEITYSVSISTPNSSERSQEPRRRRIITMPFLDDSKTTLSLFPAIRAKMAVSLEATLGDDSTEAFCAVRSVSRVILVAKTHAIVGLTRGGTAWIMRLPIRILLLRSMMSLYSCDFVVFFGFWASSCQRCCWFFTLCTACVN